MDDDRPVIVPDLLHCTRMIGQEGENIFSNVSKLANSHTVSTHEAGHPILGLKKNLIRLVGNMSYSNREIQDEVWASCVV